MAIEKIIPELFTEKNEEKWLKLTKESAEIIMPELDKKEEKNDSIRELIREITMGIPAEDNGFISAVALCTLDERKDYSEEQKKRGVVCREFLCQSALLALRVKYREGLVYAGVEKIKGVLPTELKSLAEDIFEMNRGMERENILDPLGPLGLENSKTPEESDLVAILKKGVGLIEKNAKRQEIERKKKEEETDGAALLAQQLQGQKEKQKSDMYVDWLKSLENTSLDPRLGAQRMADMEIPGWWNEGEREWRELVETVDEWNKMTAKRREYIRASAKDPKSIDSVKSIIGGDISVSESSLRKMYDRNDFRMTLELLVGRLFEKQGNTFVFKNNDKITDFYDRQGDFREKVIKELVNGRVVNDRDHGIMIYSAAFDFLEMGGQFECADIERKVNFVSDGMRTTMRPEIKMKKKVGGGEVWGGSWGEYLLAISGNNADNANNIGKRMGIVPKILAGSVLNVIVETANGEEVSLGDALCEGEEIVFGNSGKDIYSSWKNDQMAPAYDLWNYISGKNRLEFRDFREIDNVIGDWRQDLYNALQPLRNNGVSEVTPQIIAAAIGGSTGLWPFDGPFLRINNTTDLKTIRRDYVKAGKEIVGSLNLPGRERELICSFFGFDDGRANEFYHKIIDYMYYLNPKAFGREKENIAKKLWPNRV